jgi:hypothetical protein
MQIKKNNNNNRKKRENSKLKTETVDNAIMRVRVDYIVGSFMINEQCCKFATIDTWRVLLFLLIVVYFVYLLVFLDIEDSSISRPSKKYFIKLSRLSFEVKTINLFLLQQQKRSLS